MTRSKAEERARDEEVEEEIEEEIERRLREIRSDSERRMRYDRNGDGIVDQQEWEEVRRTVEAEVRTERRRMATDAGGESAGPSGRPGQPGAFTPGDLLAGRFEIREKIAEGGQGVTYRARDCRARDRRARDRRARDRRALDEHADSNGDETANAAADGTVVVKQLAVGRVDDWKAIELFEREGEALASLEHSQIPDYVGYYHLDAVADAGEDGAESDGGTGQQLFLVQEYVEGRDLAELIDGGFRLPEEEVRAFVDAMLDILEHIHSRSPVVIHRDLKPSNIIRDRQGRWHLVDFGAVQTVLPDATGGSTVVGTSGYMPVEQLMGRAAPPSDLYALGATTVHLLSHKHPADLPVRGMRLQFRDDVNISEAFAEYLERLLAPHLEDRFQSATAAREALAALDTSTGADRSSRRSSPRSADDAPRANALRKAPGRGDPGGSPAGVDGLLPSQVLQTNPSNLQHFDDNSDIERPRSTDIRIDRSGASTHIQVPALGVGATMSSGIVGLITSVFTLGFAFVMIRSGNGCCMIPFLLPFIAFGFWMMQSSVKRALRRTRVEVNEDHILVERDLGLWSTSELVQLAHVPEVDIYSTESQNGKAVYRLVLREAGDEVLVTEARPFKELAWVGKAIEEGMNGEG